MTNRSMLISSVRRQSIGGAADQFFAVFLLPRIHPLLLLLLMLLLNSEYENYDRLIDLPIRIVNTADQFFVVSSSKAKRILGFPPLS